MSIVIMELRPLPSSHILLSAHMSPSRLFPTHESSCNSLLTIASYTTRRHHKQRRNLHLRARSPADANFPAPNRHSRWCGCCCFRGCLVSMDSHNLALPELEARLRGVYHNRPPSLGLCSQAIQNILIDKAVKMQQLATTPGAAMKPVSA